MSDDTSIRRWTDPDDERRGTSTADSEAALRDIGRTAFGIDYPRDVTPRARRSLSRPIQRRMLDSGRAP